MDSNGKLDRVRIGQGDKSGVVERSGCLAKSGS